MQTELILASGSSHVLEELDILTLEEWAEQETSNFAIIKPKMDQPEVSAPTTPTTSRDRPRATGLAPLRPREEPVRQVRGWQQRLRKVQVRSHRVCTGRGHGLLPRQATRHHKHPGRRSV